MSIAIRSGATVVVKGTRSALKARKLASGTVVGDERLGSAVRLPDGFIYSVLEFDVGLVEEPCPALAQYAHRWDGPTHPCELGEGHSGVHVGHRLNGQEVHW